MGRFDQLFAYLFLIVLASCTTASGESVQESKLEPTYDPRVEELLAKMTLEEKVGQMTQLTLDMVLTGEPYASIEPHSIDEVELEEAIGVHKVGSILNCGGHSYPREFWLETIARIQQKAQETPNAIPILYGIDAIHGVTYTDNSTLTPQQIGLACTWDTALVKRLAATTAYETRASGIPWNFSPVLDIARDPRWPRFWETFGEDVLLVSDFGEAMVQGYQGSGNIDSLHVAACLKHFLGYSQTLSGKDRTAAWIPERQLREYFLPSFQLVIDAGAKTIMVNSGEVNGIPVHVNPDILTRLLRNELGFEGMVVTDWEDIKYLVTRHRVAKDYKEAIKLAIDAGIDMSMVPTDLEFPVILKELVEEGSISEERINQSVRRILQLKFELGLFEAGTPSLDDYPRFASSEARAIAYTASQESLVLLKNNETLPLNGNERVLVVGANATSLNVLNGGWTRTWQGTDPLYNTPGMPDFLSALKQRFEKVDHLDEAAFLELADFSKYDHIIGFLGETPYTETPGDIEDLDLPEEQIAVIRKLGEIKQSSTLILAEGRPRTFGDLPNGVDAMILAMLPGDQGGKALAGLLLGDFSPSGHLPFTYPRFASAHTCYDHKYTDKIHIDFSTNAVNPLFEFGDGLSYTTFSYSNLQLERFPVTVNDTLMLSVKVKNTGALEGADVVQVFISDSVASITPSVKRLRAYRKLHLKPGAEQLVEFKIPVTDLAFVGKDLNWVVEPGEFGIQVANLHQSFVVK